MSDRTMWVAGAEARAATLQPTGVSFKDQGKTFDTAADVAPIVQAILACKVKDVCGVLCCVCVCVCVVCCVCVCVVCVCGVC